jgi:hypothetical protein
LPPVAFNREASDHLRNDGFDPLESSLTSNGSSLCEVEALRNMEALRGSNWPQISPDKGPGDVHDSGRPTTRQERRRPDQNASARCMAWGSQHMQQSSSGGFGQAGSNRKFLQSAASSSGGFASASTLTALEGSPQLSVCGSMPHTPSHHGSDTSTPHGNSADLDTLAAGERWFQTSIRCSLSQPNLHSTSDRPRRNSQPGMFFYGAPIATDMPISSTQKMENHQGSSVSSGRPGRRKVAAGPPGGGEVVPSEENRPPTRCGRRPGRVQAVGLTGGRSSPPLQEADSLDVGLSRPHSLPLLHGPTTKAARTFRVSDLME